MAVKLGQGRAAPDEFRTPTIPSVYAAQMVQLAGRWGLAPAALLEGTGIEPALLDDAQARVSAYALHQLLERAIAQTAEPGFGFYYGLQLKLSSHGSVGFAAMTSATLGEALRVAERFVSLRAPLLSLRLEVEGAQAAIELPDVAVGGPVLRACLTEAIFTALVQMGRTILGRSFEASFELSYPEPAYFARFSHLWPGQVRFGRPVSRIVLSASMLDESLQMADPIAARQALRDCERELTTLLDDSSLLLSVRRQLDAREQGYPTLTELASARHVSPRTLKRRLAEHGTSYQKLLDDLRRERALKLLALETFPLERIAEQLGYSDRANFNRAFRRWLGTSPSRYRTQQRGGARAQAPSSSGK